MRAPGFIFFLVAAAILAPGAVLDRIAASAGKHVIAESDVLRYLRVTAFLDQKPVDLSPDAKHQAAEKLVDQALILSEAAESRVPLPGPDEAGKLLEQVKRSFPGGEPEYQAALERYGVAEQDVLDHLLAGDQALRFTEVRFRPEVLVSEDEIQEFYQLLAAGWRKSDGGKVPSFAESRDDVEKLLIEQRTMQALDAWLATARTQVGVSFRDKVLE